MAATLTVSNRHWMGRRGSYVVELDGAEVGRLTSFRSVKVEVDPGSHLVRVRHWEGKHQGREDQFASDPLTVRVGHEAEVRLRLSFDWRQWRGQRSGGEVVLLERR
jgi:hypothetical protein